MSRHYLSDKEVAKLISMVKGKNNVLQIIDGACFVFSACPECFSTVILIGHFPESAEAKPDNVVWTTAINADFRDILRIHNTTTNILHEAALAWDNSLDQEEEEHGQAQMH